jgi:DNA-binding transcriptional regulator YiaG
VISWRSKNDGARMNQQNLTTAEQVAQGIALWWNAKLTSFRKKHDLTVDDLARLLPAKRQLVADWENGKQQPPSMLKRALWNLDQDLTVKALQNAERAEPLHRSGPMVPFMQKGVIVIRPADGAPAIAQCQRYSSERPAEETMGNARLLVAAYNAFDSAARKLGINAVVLAERMESGGLAELVEAQGRTSLTNGSTDHES